MPFAKGKSGNPQGRPKTLTADGRALSDIAREHTEVAVGTLVSVMREGESDAARVSAANSLLDRAWGRPKQEIDVDLNVKSEILQAIEAGNRRVSGNGKPA